MTETSLQAFVRDLRAAWGPIGSELVAHCRSAMGGLSLSDPGEEWLARLLAEGPAARELHRDPVHGFMLLAHMEQEGLYRPPHDHGRAWVVYAVQSGELEVGTYGRVKDEADERLVRRDSTVLRPGEARAYLPGDVHDTRCRTERALVLRFTERDLRHEDQVERKVTRFVERDGHWRAPRA